MGITCPKCGMDPTMGISGLDGKNCQNCQFIDRCPECNAEALQRLQLDEETPFTEYNNSTQSEGMLRFQCRECQNVCKFQCKSTSEGRLKYSLVE